MKILIEVTKKNLKLNKKRTIVTIIGIMLSVSLICAVGGMVASFRETLFQGAIYQEGYNHLIIETNRKNLKILENNRDIKKIMNISNLGYSTLIGSQNEYKPYLKLLSVETSQDFLNFPFHLLKGRYPANQNEVIISNSIITNGRVNYEIGDTIKLNLGTRYACGKKVLENHYLPNDYKYDQDGKVVCEDENIVVSDTREVKIVGIIERPSYTYEEYSEAGYTIITTNLKSDDLKSYVILKNPYNYESIQRDLEDSNKFQKIKNNSDILHWEIFSFSDSTMSMLLTVSAIVILIIVVTSIFCIRNSFAISTLEKTKMYGHLRSIGATKKQIKKMVLTEGLILGLIAIPLGLFFGILADYILVIILNYLIGDFLNTNFIFTLSWLAILIAIFLGIVTIYLSSITSARKASKISPIEAIRNNQDIKINNKKLKTPKIIEKLFNIGGVIAYKNLKRSKKKYRTTVISLVVSIFTFIAMTTFMDYSFDLTGAYYQDYDYDLIISTSNLKDEDTKNILYLNNIDDYFLVYESSNYMAIKDLDHVTEYGYLTHIKESEYDQETNTFKDSKEINLSLLLLDDKSFKDYLKENKINKDIKNQAILVDYSLSYEENGKMIYKRVLDYKDNNLMTAYDINNQEFKFQIYKVLKEKPKGYENNNGIFLILNEKYYQDLKGNIKTLTLSSKYSDNLENEIKKLQLDINIVNISKRAKEEKSMAIVFSIFFYGFIAVITLIGVTNIFNTITANMTLRQKEFAILRSIGVTKKEFNRMINLEILFYSIKSLFYGIILGLIGSYLIYMGFTNGYETSYVVPFKAIIISIIFVVFLVTMIMKYSISRINKQNIIETIRNDNI